MAIPRIEDSEDEGVREGRAGDVTNFYQSAGYMPIGTTGLTQGTVDALNQQHGTSFADPKAYYDYVYGPGGSVETNEGGDQFYKLPEGRTADQRVNDPLNYTAAPMPIGDMLPYVWVGLLTAGMGGMLPGTESIFGSAAAAGGEAAGASFLPDAVSYAGEAGLMSGGEAGAGLIGGDLAGTGLEIAATDAGPTYAESLAAGAGDTVLTAEQVANEWMAPNIYDELAFDPMAGQVGGDGIGSTVESVASGAGDVASSVKDVLPSDTQTAARRLVQSAEDVTSAEGGSGAWNATSGREGGWGSDLLNRIFNSDKVLSAVVTGGLQVAGGVGTAMLNRDTMERKSELDLQNAEDLAKFKTDQSRNNRYQGIINVRPATRAPLRRLTGGNVYDERGLLRRS